jgi:phosphatidylserine/phosphatidylglycerophosphate/cardiolipin synthase-like enzyme
VILVTNKAAHNDDFNSRMQSKCSDTNLLKIIQATELHQKGILGDRFSINGSMNLTYNGVYLNDEHITFRCDVASVEERRLELENRWRSNL